MIEIFNRLKRNPNLFTKIIIASFFVNILALATPIYVIQVLQRYVAYGVSSTLVTLVVGILFVSLFEFFFRNIRHRMTREIEAENTLLADRVMKKLVSIKSSYYSIQKNFRPDIVTRNVNLVQNTFNASTTLILIDVPFVLIFLIALFLINYQLGLIATLFILVPFIILNFYRNRIDKLSNVSTQLNYGTARLHDSSSTRFETVKYFNLINAVKKAWGSIIERTINTKEDLEAQRNILSSFMALSTTLLTIIIIAWGAVLAVDGQISVGALIGANILGSRAIAPIIRLVQNMEPINKATVSLGELNQFLRIPQDSHDGSEIRDFKGIINMKDLHFQYPNTKVPVFEGLNCVVKPGDITAIKGSNGSGKSTLIKLIIRILEFNRGQIFYDSVEINQLSSDWLRSNLIYLPQEPKFIDGTLLDNLLGLTEIKKDKMNEILKSVDLIDFVNSDPSGIQMQLPNRGENLPFGIRKRIALARAMIVSGQVVVFDEPSESLDERGRTSLYNLISKMAMENRTIIVATQDENIIKQANILLDLDKKPSPQVTYDLKGEK